VGVPSMQKFLEKRVNIANADILASGMKFARSEALKRGQTVAMCITTTADNVQPSCTNATPNWASGWLIFVDANNDRLYQTTELLVKVQQAFTNNGALNGTAARWSINFTADGLSLGNTATITAVPPNQIDSGAKRCIYLTNQGRARVDVPTDGECAQ
jgi:type IV fimbrial biogenesis protein FimT